MHKNTYTTEQVRDALAQAVEARGSDYVYPDASGNLCYYSTAQGEPGCIVGYAVSVLDKDAFDSLRRLEPVYSLDVEIAGVPQVSRRSAGDVYAIVERKGDTENFGNVAVIGAPEEAVRGLKAAQVVQDSGDTWGEALAAFDKEVQAWTATHNEALKWLDEATSLEGVGTVVVPEPLEENDAFQAAADADLARV